MNDFPLVETTQLELTEKGMVGGQVTVDYDEWLEFGKRLWDIRKAVQWAIGDWINYGEDAYGERYAQALDVTEVSYRTLQNYAWLSKSFPISRRREKLSWSHHEAVKGIKDVSKQDALLDIAESQQMGRDELRDVVKKYKNPDGLLVVGVPYRVLEGRLARAMMGEDILFIPDNGEKIREGRARLYLYEDGE